MGLRAGDLTDLVLPEISIDEYVSKIGSDVQMIVVAFFVLDEDPAVDLSRFIEKSGVKLIDCEISAAPTEDGYFLVFVEFTRNDQFPDEVISVIEEISVLVNNAKWSFKPYRYDKPIPLTKENIKKYITLDKREVIKKEREKEQKKEKSKKDDEKVKEFFSCSDLRDVLFEKNDIVLRGRGEEVFEYIRFGRLERVLVELGLTGSPIRLDEDSRRVSKRVSRFLGPGWNADLVDDYLVMSYQDGDHVLVVRP